MYIEPSSLAHGVPVTHGSHPKRNKHKPMMRRYLLTRKIITVKDRIFVVLTCLV